MSTKNKNSEIKKNNFPSFDVHDFKAHFDHDSNDWVDVRPLPFIPGIQPKIPLNSTISIYGRRRSGKSEFTKWCIQGIKDYIPWWWTFSKTKHNSFWAGVQPDPYIIKEFDADVLTRIKKRQEAAIDAFTSGKLKNPRAGIIWDDYNGKDIRFNDALADYYYTGRHFGTINFFNAQVYFSKFFSLWIWQIAK